MKTMTTFSLGPRIEVTAALQERITDKELTAALHRHRCSAKAAVVDIGFSQLMMAVMATSKELELRSIEIMHDLELDGEGLCDAERAYADEVDLMLRRYLGQFTATMFTTSRMAPDERGAILTAHVGADEHSTMDKYSMPYYSTIVGLSTEIAAITLFAQGVDLSRIEHLIETNWFGLEDMTKQLFVGLLTAEFAGVEED